MPLFGGRSAAKSVIPPVQEPSYDSPPTSDRYGDRYGDRHGGNSNPPRPNTLTKSSSSSYNASRDGDPYNGAESRYGDRNAGGGGLPYNPYQARDRTHRNAGAGDVYSRGDAGIDADAARNELFSGYNPAKGGGSGRFMDGPQLRAPPPAGQETEEDVEGIKQSTRQLKQESVNSTRNALRMAREAEETARSTMGRLADQSEKLANTERHLDVSKGHSSRADDKANELKVLNRSIFRPAITFNKDAKRAAQEAKVNARYEDERTEREKSMMDVRETQNRLGRAQTYGRGDDEDDEEGLGRGGGYRSAAAIARRQEERKRYQFEADGEDNAQEDELDDNLEEIGSITKNLKALGLAMGQELDSQNTRIGRIDQKAGNLDQKIYGVTQKLNKVK